MIDHHVRTIARAADDRNVLGVVGFTATRRATRRPSAGPPARSRWRRPPSPRRCGRTGPRRSDRGDATDRSFRSLRLRGDGLYSLSMLDGTVQFLAIDDERPRALLESEAEAIRAWAEGNRRDVRATVGTVLDVRALETVTDALGRTPPTARRPSLGCSHAVSRRSSRVQPIGERVVTTTTTARHRPVLWAFVGFRSHPIGGYTPFTPYTLCNGYSD